MSATVIFFSLLFGGVYFLLGILAILAADRDWVLAVEVRVEGGFAVNVI